MILVIDNYDSFVHNLARYVVELGAAVEVVRNDALTTSEIERRKPQGIIISPGPCTPREAGVSMEVIQKIDAPMLGVCLGHQAIGHAFGADVVRANVPVHGRASWVRHDGSPLYEGTANPFQAARYHSLVVRENGLPECLRATAWTEDGVLMGLQHLHRPVYGVQFHPESILTDGGKRIVANFLRLAGIEPTEPGIDERPPIARSPELPSPDQLPIHW